MFIVSHFREVRIAKIKTNVCVSGKEYLLRRNTIRTVTSWSFVDDSGSQETIKLE